MIENLPIDEMEKLSLAEILITKIEPYIQSLKALKNNPDEIIVNEISQWKAKVDKRREKYFDGALHAIDSLINKQNPISTSLEEHEHLVDVLSQIAYLEEEIPLLFRKVEETDLTDTYQQQLIESRLTALQKELHQLNLDLRLTPELIDRLQVLYELATTIHKKIIE